MYATHWVILIVIGITIYYFCCFIQKMNVEEDKEREKRKRQQEEVKQEKLSKEKEAQERIRQGILARETQKKEREQRVAWLVANSQLLSQDLPKRINYARDAVDNVEQEYQDGAFNPFWDAVERAVTNLAHFNEGIKQITQNCSAYQTESQQLDSPPPVFDWKGVVDTTDGITTADRLQRIVRSAQKNPWFASIYNQRKTNQILVAGFTGLGQALNEIAYRINESTAALSAAVADLSFTVSETVSDASEKAIEAGRENTRAIVKSAQLIKEQAEAEAETRREDEQKKLEMLDNIQRGKKPSFPEYQGTLR